MMYFVHVIVWHVLIGCNTKRLQQIHNISTCRAVVDLLCNLL